MTQQLVARGKLERHVERWLSEDPRRSSLREWGIYQYIRGAYRNVENLSDKQGLQHLGCAALLVWRAIEIADKSLGSPLFRIADPAIVGQCDVSTTSVDIDVTACLPTSVDEEMTRAEPMTPNQIAAYALRPLAERIYERIVPLNADGQHKASEAAKRAITLAKAFHDEINAYEKSATKPDKGTPR